MLVVPIFLEHRGCPHQCLFCNQHVISGGDSGAASLGDDELAATIETWLSRSPGHGKVQVAFYGGSFTCLPEAEQQRFFAAVRPFLAAGRVDSIRLSTRPDCLEPPIIERLKAGGVAMVELGVQSLDDTVLRAARRGHDADDSRRAHRLLKGAGVGVGVQLLPGLPGETGRSFLRGVREVIEWQPDLVRIYPAVVVEHSGLAHLYRKGLYAPLSLARAIAWTRRARELFLAAGIPVVRMGLQPSQTLGPQVVAGPYHPAFGELVISREWFRRIRRLLADLPSHQNMTIFISHRDHSAVLGPKKINLRRLAELGFGDRFCVVAEKGRKRGSITYVVS